MKRKVIDVRDRELDLPLNAQILALRMSETFNDANTEYIKSVMLQKDDFWAKNGFKTVEDFKNEYDKFKQSYYAFAIFDEHYTDAREALKVKIYI